MLESHDIEPGKCCIEAMAKADLLRISKAEYKAEDSNKLRRKAKEVVTYAAGEF